MRAPVAPLHRGPQAISQVAPTTTFQHAPNAALLIDFDNVTMGIRSDLAGELRSLLGSEIIKGKVAVQRAYADWRRYPQYIVPLAESSIDMIMAPAYGTSKKNATDIRLSVDAMELVFTRPEIGTYILLSGDSDFASLVTKLKEYGKYVIGVGIRESSSDLLVMNCDEYYSYNALAGLVKAGEEEVVKWDPWELVTEAINRMVKNGDVMRSDRLKQVMQDIDPSFDEKNLGMSKFSKFCLEASSQGLLKVTKLENGQLEVAPPEGGKRPEVATAAPVARPAPNGRSEESRERDERGGRRGRRGRGRGGRDREDRGVTTPSMTTATQPSVTGAGAAGPVPAPAAAAPDATAATTATTATGATAATQGDDIGQAGERLTMNEAFDLVRRAAASFIANGGAISGKALRRRAFELLGRDSVSLGDRYFDRVLRDAHDAEVIDLRRRGDDFEVSLPAEVAPVSEQLNRAAAARSQAASPTAAAAPAAPRGMGPRGIPSRGRQGGRLAAPPPELLAVGVVEEAPVAVALPLSVPEEQPVTVEAETRPAGRPVPRGRGRARAVVKPPAEVKAPSGEAGAPTAAHAPAKKKPRRARAKKGAPREAAA
jgi:uncharacterized LabA/DUF88 family protein